MSTNCLLCGTELENISYGHESTGCICPKCGSYSIANYDEYWLKRVFGKVCFNDENIFLFEKDNIDDYKRCCASLSCYIERENPKWKKINRYPVIDFAYIKHLFSSNIIPQTPEEKVRVLLNYINTHSQYSGQTIPVTERTIYSDKQSEIEFLLKELQDSGYIKYVARTKIIKNTQTNGIVQAVPQIVNFDTKLTLKGVTYISEERIKGQKDTCFVAMWFDPSMDEVWDKVIVSACLEAGYKAVRVDKEQHNDDITDHIIAGIKTSAFVIADLSGYRGGVYYEAGYAKGLNKETILTCSDEWFNNDAKENGKVHFDVNHQNIIVWDKTKLDTFKKALVDRIIATVGQGLYIKS